MDHRGWVPLFVNSDHYQGNSDWAELRINGPSYNEFTRGDTKLTCLVNVLLTSYKGDDDYKIYAMTDIFKNAFDEICCYKYGSGPDDDQSYFGTLMLEKGNAGKIDIVHFGLIQPESKFRRSFVEAAFYMELNNTN